MNTFYSTKETLDKIEEIISNKEKGVYLRFGDGDLNLAMNISESYNAANTNLMYLLKDAFNLKGENVLKALPLHNKGWDTLEPGMFPGNHEGPVEWAENLVNKYLSVSQENSDLEFYSAVALCHIATHDPDIAISFLKKLKNNVKYFIGNQNIPREILETMFGKDVIHIKTPEKNSFSEFDNIYEETIKQIGDDDDYSVIVTSMGCPGRALQKILWDKYDNFFLFDYGSLMDALCGWNTRAWIELTKFDKDSFLEKL